MKFVAVVLALALLSSVYADPIVTTDGLHMTVNCNGDTMITHVDTNQGKTSSDVPITGVTFENCATLTLIGTYAFRHAELTTLTIPNSVTQINEMTFGDIDGNTKYGSITTLKTLHLGGGWNPISSRNSMAIFSNHEAIETLTIAEGVTSIGEHSFSNAPLISLTLPNSVTTIQNNAFQGSRHTLVTLHLGGGWNPPTTIVFQYFDAITTLTIAEGVTSIGYWAFFHAPLNKVSVMSASTTIGTDAFYSMPNKVYGCIEPNYVEYNPSANFNHGHCVNRLGCTDPATSTYDENADVDDGSCITCSGDTVLQGRSCVSASVATKLSGVTLSTKSFKGKRQDQAKTELNKLGPAFDRTGMVKNSAEDRTSRGVRAQFIRTYLKEYSETSRIGKLKFLKMKRNVLDSEAPDGDEEVSIAFKKQAQQGCVELFEINDEGKSYIVPEYDNTCASQQVRISCYDESDSTLIATLTGEDEYGLNVYENVNLDDKLSTTITCNNKLFSFTIVGSFETNDEGLITDVVTSVSGCPSQETSPNGFWTRGTATAELEKTECEGITVSYD